MKKWCLIKPRLHSLFLIELFTIDMKKGIIPIPAITIQAAKEKRGKRKGRLRRFPPKEFMNRKKAYLLINGALCLVIPVLLALAAISIYREGMAAREAGDFLAWIYTTDKIADRFAPIAPVFFCGIGLALAGLILGVEEYRIGKPAREIHMQKKILEKKIRQPSPEMKREVSLQRRYSVLH